MIRHVRNHLHLYLLLLICILAACIRVYHMKELAVFLADQASDSTAVYNIVHGKFTLLGPITSVGGFYNGPIVYYLMAPIFLIFRSNTLSGTIFQSALSVGTIPLVYLLGKKLSDERTGLGAAFLFAISPLMVDYSRAAFNSYPAVFFSTLIVYLFYVTLERYRDVTVLILGIALGWIIQMHYLTVIFVPFLYLYPLVFKRKLATIRYYCFLLLGTVLGIAPFLLFEVRHQFFNIRLFLTYLTSSHDGVRSFVYSLKIWPDITGALLFGNHTILGLGGICIISIFLLMLVKKEPGRFRNHLPLIILFLLVCGMNLVYGRYLQPHYVIVLDTTIIILIAESIVSVSKKSFISVLFICFILFCLNFPSWNFQKSSHPVQDGLTIPDFEKTATIIHDDTKSGYNVAMHAEGDNRAMPLRYTLLLLDEHPMEYVNYAGSSTLYFLLKRQETVTSQTMWEYMSFGPSHIQKKWDINAGYVLYKLEKAPR